MPLLAAAVLLAGGTYAAVKFAPADSSAAGPTPTVAATESTVPPDADPTSASPSTTPTPTTKPTATANPAAAKSLAACQARVRAGDTVVDEAKIGVAHWSIHVNAQTLANIGKIKITEMQGRFKETRLAGPADQQRYKDALTAYEKLKGSCKAVSGASASVASSLQKCAKRDEAQQPVLAAGANGMADWQSHLAAMQRNKDGHVYDPQDVWLRAWRAAPPHIKAFNKVIGDYDPARC